ncbi:GNAT family N-acetyltransferase [Streptomyces milbemycinicus]|uniref:GNAT family N-acetyltransferase n=1 Tax=Streptomyces milbemycinicus TaxID=476552 RepID=UPI0033F9CED0
MEAAQAVLAWAFGPLRFEQITAVIHHGNTASAAVAERLGFTHLREDTVLGRPCTVYALPRDNFPRPRITGMTARLSTRTVPDTPGE